MSFNKICGRAVLGLAFAVVALATFAADYPAPKEGHWTVQDFNFHTGEVLPELHLAYTTVGAAEGEPVLVLHGTTGTAETGSRSWIMRRLITDSIRNDPEWKGGNYTTQPKSAQFASVFYSFATSGGNQALYKAAPTREKADALLDARMKAPFRGDAND